jgi:hypothetical protein
MRKTITYAILSVLFLATFASSFALTNAKACEPVYDPPPPPTKPPISTDPPLSTDPPISTDPPLSTDPPISTNPPLSTDPPLSINPPLADDPPLAASVFSSVTLTPGWTWYFFGQATGGTGSYAYQWYEGTTMLVNQNSMVLAAIKDVPGTYNYYLVVTDDAGSMVRSNVVTLTVINPSA